MVLAGYGITEPSEHKAPREATRATSLSGDVALTCKRNYLHRLADFRHRLSIRSAGGKTINVDCRRRPTILTPAESSHPATGGDRLRQFGAGAPPRFPTATHNS